MSKRSVHCCKFMTNYIADEKIPIGYEPVYREYFIPVLHSSAIQLIFYCPWCGHVLPISLGDEYFDVLSKEYHIDDPVRAEEAGTLPEEFKTDEWWKKRRL